MKKLIVASTLFALVLLAGVSFQVFVVRNLEENIVSTASVPSQPGTSNTMPQLPIYPDAKNLQTITDTNPLAHTTTYTSDDPYQTVLQFYSENLADQGWQQLSGDTFPSFEWKDASGSLPFGLSLVGSISALEVGGTSVAWRLEYWPETDRLPTYPGGEKIEQPKVADTAGYQTALVFDTNDPPENVGAYYKSVLPNQGWKFHTEDSRPISIYPGLKFASYYCAGKNLSVATETLPQGKVRVTLRLQEFDLPAEP
jgi:hypothetical protein